MTSLPWQNPNPVLRGVRVPAIDELKGLAILLVLIFHATGVLNWPNYIQGQVGVDVFLILSGLTLAIGSAADEPTGTFFRRRFFRIFPAYWIALGLFLSLDYFLRGMVHPGHRVWFHVAGLHAFSREFDLWGINDSLWFIALIVPLYAVFAALRRWLDRITDILGAGFLITAIVCTVYIAADNLGALVHLGVRIPSFFIGLILGRALCTQTFELKISALLGVGTLAMSYLALVKGVNFNGIFAAFGVIAAYLAARTYLPAIIARLLGIFGLYSYEIYLFHQPLIREYNLYAWQHLAKVPTPSPNQILAGIFAGLIVTAVIAVGVHHLVNLLFQRRVRTA